MASYHNAPSDANLFPSPEQIRLRQAVQHAVPNAPPELIAQHATAAERAGVPLVPHTVAQIAANVHREAVQQQAARDAAYEKTVRRYSMPRKQHP